MKRRAPKSFKARLNCKCNKKFKTSEELLQHGIRDHKVQTGFRWCSLCDKLINATNESHWSGLKGHLNSLPHRAKYDEAAYNELQSCNAKRSKPNSTESNNTDDFEVESVSTNDEAMLSASEALLSPTPHSVSAQNPTITPANNPPPFVDVQAVSSNPTTASIASPNPKPWTDIGLDSRNATIPIIYKTQYENPKLPPSLESSKDYFPFPSADYAFFTSLYLEDPSSARFIDKILKFFNDPALGHNVSTMPRSLKDITSFVPRIKNKTAINPEIGFPLTLELSKNSKYAFFPLQSVIQTALCDPELAKYLIEKHYPCKADIHGVTDIYNAPISSSNSFTTLELSLDYAAKKKCDPIFTGDLVEIAGKSYGIVTSLYYDSLTNSFCGDVQNAVPDSWVVRTPTDIYYPEPVESQPWNQLIVIPDDVKKDIPLIQMRSKMYSTRSVQSDVILIEKQLIRKNGKLVERKFYGTHSNEGYHYNITRDLNRLRRNLSNDERDSLHVITLEVSKDELVTYRTRGYLCDVQNWCFCQTMLELREKFSSIWSAAAFGPEVTQYERYQHMVKTIREGERGFWVWTAKKGWIFVVVAFILYSADMAEFTKATGSVQKRGKVRRWCYRCDCEKRNLSDPTYPLKAEALTPEKRLDLYHEAEAEPKTTAKQTLRQAAGLSEQFPQLAFSVSLRLAEAGISDLLHNWKINIPGWILALWWMFLNVNLGRSSLVALLREKGSCLNNCIIKYLFQSKSKEKLGKPTPITCEKIGDIKKKAKMSGADFDVFVTILDEIVEKINKMENYTEEINKMMEEIPDEELKKLADKISKEKNPFPKDELKKTPMVMFGLLFQHLIRIYNLLNTKTMDFKHVQEVVKQADVFFTIINKFFPNSLNKPSIHDSMHMIFQQLQEVIPPSHCNTSKTEALNIEHRFAALSGNNRFCEFVVLFNQWTARLLQFIVDGSFFLGNPFSPNSSRSKPSSLPAYIKAGGKTQEIIRELFCSDTSRIQLPPSASVSPYLPPSWFIDRKVPKICSHGISIRALVKAGVGKRVRFTKDEKTFQTDFICECCTPLIRDCKEGFIKSRKASLPKIGELSLGDVVTVPASLIISGDASKYIGSDSMILDDCEEEETSNQLTLDQDEEDSENDDEQDINVDCIVQASGETIDLTKKSSLSIRLKEIVCLPPTKTPTAKKHIVECEKVDKLKKEVISATLDKRILERQISEMQKQLSEVAIKIKNLERVIEVEHKKVQDSWTPSVLFKGVIVKKKANPINPFQAAKAGKETDKRVVFCARHTKAFFKSKQCGEELKIEKYF